MPDIHQLFLAEQANLRRLKAERPEAVSPLPPPPPAEMRARVGISVDFGHLINGYLGLYPQDFIVEEIQKDGRISAIEPAPVPQSLPAPKSKRSVLIADMVKTGLSTIEARDSLVAALGINPDQIGYAGIKDKIAVTSQRVSFANVDPQKILTAQAAGVFLKNFHYSGQAVYKGTLRGNRFSILVRTPVTLGQGWLNNVVKKFDHGFYNFYYLQRFGEPRVLSHYLGRLLLQKNYEGAVRMALFDPGLQTMPITIELRQRASTLGNNWAEIKTLYQQLPYSFYTELTLLDHLINHPTDYRGALQQVHDQIVLWIYAYGSWLFNRYISALVAADEPLPTTIPLLLNPRAYDVPFYTEALAADGINNIEATLAELFGADAPQTKNEVAPRIPVDIVSAQVVDQGVAIGFALPTAAYATTFLSHIFDLYRDLPIPDWVDRTKHDTKAILGLGSVAKTESLLGDYMLGRADMEGGGWN